MKTILQVIIKEFLQIRRDKKMLPMIFIPPVLQLLLLGYAANLDVKDLPLIIYDQDNSGYSRELYQKFSNSGYFDIKAFVEYSGEVERSIENGYASMALIIPPNFASDLKTGREPQVQLIVDGSESNSASIGMNYANMIISDFSGAIMVDKLEFLKSQNLRPVKINPEIRVWFNPELKSRNFMIPGVLALLLMIMTLILTSLAIVKEKEIGTIEQLIVTPIKPAQLIAGKLAPFTIIAAIDIILVLMVARFWFNVPIRGSVILLFTLSFVFLLTTLGLGLFVSTIAKSQQQAMMIAVFFIMLPMVFLSGFVFPIENMPKVIQFFTYAMPLRYFFTIVRGLFLKGVGMEQLWDETAVMLLIGGLIFISSVLRFQKKL
jgi:ABC-2 type transport system permease protein